MRVVWPPVSCSASTEPSASIQRATCTPSSIVQAAGESVLHVELGVHRDGRSGGGAHGAQDLARKAGAVLQAAAPLHRGGGCCTG